MADLLENEHARIAAEYFKKQREVKAGEIAFRTQEVDNFDFHVEDVL